MAYSVDERALQNQITCGVCRDASKKLKLLGCFHVFCEGCLKPLVRGDPRRQSIFCPRCHEKTLLPAGGVSELSEESDYANLEIDALAGKKPALILPLKEPLFCSNHYRGELHFYCCQCEELICRDCLTTVHRGHQYDLASEGLAKQQQSIATALKPVEKQLASLDRALKLHDAEQAAVVDQKTAVVEEIHSTIQQLRKSLEVREAVLVSQAERMAQRKLKTLATQREELESQIAQHKSCLNSASESSSQGEILKMKKPLMKQIGNLKSTFNPKVLAVPKQATLRFKHSLHELKKACDQFGKVCWQQICPEKCRVSGKGIEIAMRGHTAVLSVETLDSIGEPCLIPLGSLSVSLESDDGSYEVSSFVSKKEKNNYGVTYQPQNLGEHKLHICIEKHPIMNSPFMVTVLPNFDAPSRMIEGLNRPWGIAVREGGNIVVAEQGSHCASIINTSGDKWSFNFRSGAPLQVNNLAFDTVGNILMADSNNRCIWKVPSSGQHLQTAGVKGKGHLLFSSPVGVAVHPNTHRVYVADSTKNSIVVLNADLTFHSSFGSAGSSNGQFKNPYNVSFDREGNAYVADFNNHRIQVFSGDGAYLRQFGKKGTGEGELDQPSNVTVDSHDLVYVTERENNRVSIFSTNGTFIRSFGSQGSGNVQFNSSYGIAVDMNGAVYVSDTYNHRIQIFT